MVEDWVARRHRQLHPEPRRTFRRPVEIPRENPAKLWRQALERFRDAPKDWWRQTLSKAQHDELKRKYGVGDRATDRSIVAAIQAAELAALPPSASVEPPDPTKIQGGSDEEPPPAIEKPTPENEPAPAALATLPGPRRKNTCKMNDTPSPPPRQPPRAAIPTIGGGGTASAAPAVQAKPSAPGWHGIEPMSIEVDHQLVMNLTPNGEARKVMLAPGSPARALRTGDYVISMSPSPMGEMSFNDCNALGLPVGTELYVTFFRPGRGAASKPTTTTVRLRQRPKAKPQTLGPPPVPCGEPVRRGQRLAWLAKVTGDKCLSPTAKALATRLVTYHVRRAGWTDDVTHAELAAEFRISVDTVQKELAALANRGFLLISSGRKSKRPNRYEPTWPAGSNVVHIGTRVSAANQGDLPQMRGSMCRKPG